MEQRVNKEKIFFIFFFREGASQIECILALLIKDVDT